ncbi:hypothetical protein KVR01_011992 [Diaporthe batatas]|uniref:uncharacterized protein n=1 Tax=Diaporthe batatas TaxID=748121 RepID=UPI001D0395F8|nr:uncharacterized protein KVR01_011992 [Diaporthe batatas]KAG8158231.1 hypothetical protein KVR01_011992 [Diaporthe batatas]
MEYRYRYPRMEEVEEVERYVPGGYHPVDIGDRLGPEDGSHYYTVLHKLGYGGFSTVWLTRCSQDDHYYALKILTADLPESQGKDLKILQSLKNDGFEHPHIVHLYESFEVSGPNGSHTCLVLPALGPILDEVYGKQTLAPETRYQICQQVATGVAALHERGICHGDLTPANVVFELPDTSSMDIPEVCALLGPIESARLRLRNGARSEHGPKYVIQRPTFSKLMSELPTTLQTVRIIDFGEAFPTTRPRSFLGVPVGLGYFPPELCFGYAASPGSDMWMLASLMYQALGTAALFPCFFPIFEILVGTAMPILGPLPDHWRGRFDYDKYGYREPESGELKNPERVNPGWWWDEAKHNKSIRGRMESDLAPRFSSAQLDFLAALLGDMVCFEPEKRISAAEVVQRLRSASTMFGATQQS